jgi:hypothetical protein
MDKIRDSEHAEMLRALIAALHRRKIKTIAILESPRLFANENAIGKYLKNITSFNNDAESQDEKFDGILADTRPDLMTGKSPRYTNGVLYHWSPYSYGKGRDNDMLMKDTFSMLTELKKEMPDGMDLGQGISPCYEEEFRKGALSCGGVNEFLASCDFVALFCFSSDRREIYNLSSNTLKFARKKSSVLICAKTVVSKYGGADKDESLSWKSWFKFVKDIEYVSDNSSSYESFGGMIFYDFNGLERMLE